MSVNKFMHPRSVYKIAPNFKQLAIDYPDFRKHTKQDITGKVTIDFKDANALQALSTVLLKKDFGLDVDIPITRMIPTIPLRLNYILWIEDLLSISNSGDTITGIDIGTGASCIYPLIAARKNGWRMIATDIDVESIKLAEHNVIKNSLQSLITVKKVTDTTILNEALPSDAIVDFSMCNPPFFSSLLELNPSYKARKLDRPRPRNAFCAAPTEAVVEGGEIKFIRQMIDESKVINKCVRIYTTMVGHKSSLPALKKLLREAHVQSFKQTKFCQGHTTRWALAWTYHDDINLCKIPEATYIAAKKTKPMQHNINGCTVPLAELASKITDIFDSLKLTYNIIGEAKNCLCYVITANTNTWSHQRRKRREQERLNAVLGDGKNDISERLQIDTDIQKTSALVADLNVHSPKSPKRELDDDEFYTCKKVKINDSDECYVKGLFNIRKDHSNCLLEMLFEEGNIGKDSLHQILQYIKNNLKL